MGVVVLDGSTRLCLAVVADYPAVVSVGSCWWRLLLSWVVFAPSVTMWSCEVSGKEKDHHQLAVVVLDGSTRLCLAVFADYTAVAAVGVVGCICSIGFYVELWSIRNGKGSSSVGCGGIRWQQTQPDTTE